VLLDGVLLTDVPRELVPVDRRIVDRLELRGIDRVLLVPSLLVVTRDLLRWIETGWFGSSWLRYESVLDVVLRREDERVELVLPSFDAVP
jgi:hypothetical protein